MEDSVALIKDVIDVSTNNRAPLVLLLLMLIAILLLQLIEFIGARVLRTFDIYLIAINILSLSICIYILVKRRY